jgi:hypothetical protein
LIGLRNLIHKDALDDFPHLFEDEEALVAENGWDEITKEFTKEESFEDYGHKVTLLFL